MSTTFSVRLIAKGDTRISETRRIAASEAVLRREIEAAGARVLRITPEQGPSTSAVGLGRAAARFDAAAWCRELNTLLRAGMTAVEAVDTVRLQAGSGRQAELQLQLLRSLHEGKSLSGAMRESGSFPAVLVASVAASERTSNLVEALDDYLRFDGQMQALRRQAVSAAIYPAVVMGFGAVVALFLLVYVVPRFSQMYSTLRGTVSTSTELMIGLSQALTRHSELVMAVVALLLVLTWVGWRWGWWRALAAQLVERTPLVSDAAADFRLAQLYQSLALTLRGGYPLTEALLVCESLGLGTRTTLALTRSREAIERGQAASQAFASAGLADLTAQRLLGVGERTGQFAPVLQTLAARHSDAFATFMQRAARMVEPLLLLLVALVVGTIVVMMYMPVFDVAGGLR